MPKPPRRFPIPWTPLQFALVIVGGWLALISGPRSVLADPSDGTRIRVASVPRDSAEVSEFLLVPYVGACVNTPPPPHKQLVYVQMEKGLRVPVSFWDPVWIHGTLTVDETTNLYGSVSFKMAGNSITPYEW